MVGCRSSVERNSEVDLSSALRAPSTRRAETRDRSEEFELPGGIQVSVRGGLLDSETFQSAIRQRHQLWTYFDGDGGGGGNLLERQKLMEN